MARTAEEYRNLLLSLLPKGKAWTRSLSSLIYKICYGLGEEFARLDTRADDLVRESYPNTTVELLPEHEKDYDIPGECGELGETTEERQEAVHAALLRVGQQYPDYYIEIAEALGYTVTIEQFRPFWSGFGQSGDPCGDQWNLFYWKVNIDLSSVEECREVNLTNLICKIYPVRPAHTIVLFDFIGAEFSRAFSNAFDRIPHYDNSWCLGEFSRDFDNSFANAYDYDGVNYTGAFSQAFSIAFDRHSGGAFSNDFDISFLRQR